jgi:hypothetical protein
VKLCYILESSTERALLLKGINCAKGKKKTLLSPPSTVPPALTRWGQLIIIVQWAVIAFFFFSVFDIWYCDNSYSCNFKKIIL